MNVIEYNNDNTNFHCISNCENKTIICARCGEKETFFMNQHLYFLYDHEVRKNFCSYNCREKYRKEHNIVEKKRKLDRIFRPRSRVHYPEEQ